MSKQQDELAGMPAPRVMVRNEFKLLPMDVLVDEEEVPELEAEMTRRQHTQLRCTKVAKALANGLTVYTITWTEQDPEEG